MTVIQTNLCHRVCPGCQADSIARYWTRAAQDNPSDGLYREFSDRWNNLKSTIAHLTGTSKGDMTNV